MTNRNEQLESTYLSMISESVARLCAARSFLAHHSQNANLPDLESAILQTRKALEATALASIAPNRSAYESFRAKANDQPDYTKDYHARKIFRALGKINKNFYPMALVPAVRQLDGTFHFGRKESGYLTKKRFESLYDRFGRHLHAHNSWAGSLGLKKLAADLPTAIDEALSLLELHATFIQTAELNAVWVVEAPSDGSIPRVIRAESDGEFVVQDS